MATSDNVIRAGLTPKLRSASVNTASEHIEGLQFSCIPQQDRICSVVLMIKCVYRWESCHVDHECSCSDVHVHVLMEAERCVRQKH